MSSVESLRIQIRGAGPGKPDEDSRPEDGVDERDTSRDTNAEVGPIKSLELTGRFMAWERSFETRIKSIRQNELSWQARNYQIEVAFNCIWGLTPVLVTVVSFLVRFSSSAKVYY